MIKRFILSAVAVISLLTYIGCEKENTEGSKIETLSAEKGSLCVVTLNGCVRGLESVALDFECGIEYSTDASFVEGKVRRIAGKKYSEDPYSVILTNIISGQKYYYRAYYINQLMSYYGEVKDFSFTWDAPQVLTISAGLNGKVVLTGLIKDLGRIEEELCQYYPERTEYGYSNSFYYGFQYSTTESFEPYSTGRILYTGYNSDIPSDTIVCYLSQFDIDFDTQYYYRTFFNIGSLFVSGNVRTFNFTPQENGSENGYQFVELGLSVKWATFNVGATMPEEYGDYYAWGEVEHYYEVGYAQENPQSHWKDGFSTGYSRNWTNYKFRASGDSDYTIKFSKYNTIDHYGTIDNRKTLDLEDDVAHVTWGGCWRMPTKEERDELYNNCSWTWTSQNGVNGFLIRSKHKAYSDRFIFLPAAGYRCDTGLYDVGQDCRYWFSSLLVDNERNPDSPNAASVFDGTSSTMGFGGRDRFNGLSIRPVCP